MKTAKDDIFDLASITKIAGATLALMKLFDDGLIKLDDPINVYVDVKGQFGKVTLREALAHQGGLHPWIAYHHVIRKKDGTFRKKDLTISKDEDHEFAITDSLFIGNEFYEKRIKKLIGRSEVTRSPSYRDSGLFFNHHP